MTNPYLIDAGLHWAAVVIYAVATVINVFGLIFSKNRAERISYFIVAAGMIIHGAALLYRWNFSGHGPYMTRYEVLSSNAWILIFMFVVFSKIYPRIRPASVIVFPFTFLLIAIGMFMNPDVHRIPPTLKSTWLVLHVTFYKVALGTFVIALAFSVFYIMKKRRRSVWLEKLPDIDGLDSYAYRFTGFGFIFWAIGMLAGSIWAHDSWGRYWGWDPIEVWSLITWICFGIYLHLRRFFGWKGDKAAVFFIACFVLSLVTIFFVPLIESSIHSQYFR